MIGLLAIAIAVGLLAVFVVWVYKRIADEKTRSQGITAVAIVYAFVVLAAFTLNFFALAPIAIGAGLLVVLIVWVSKRIADEKTRSQTLTGAALVIGMILVGIFVTRSSVHQQVTLVPPTPTYHAHPPAIDGHAGAAWAEGATTNSGDISAESHRTFQHGARMEIRSQSTPNHFRLPQVEARFAWGPVAVIALTAGGILLVIVSKRNLPAALAGLAIIGGLVLFYRLSERTVAVQEIHGSGTHRLAHKNWDSSTTFTTTAPENGSSSRTVVENQGHASASPPADISNETKTEPTPDSTAAAEKKSENVKAERETTTATDSLASEEVTNKDASGKTQPESGPRPPWIETEPTMLSGTYRATAVSGPYKTQLECEDSIAAPVEQAFLKYAERYLRHLPRFYAWYNPNDVHKEIVQDRYFEPVTSEIVGPMWKLHVLLEIDQSDVSRFTERAREAEAKEAVAITSSLAACVLGALAIVYGGLRFIGRKKPAVEPATAETTA